MVTIREASEADMPGVASFYQAVSYSGRIEASDRILVAEKNGGIAGALRLCTEEGVLVLRGMRVLEDLRRQHLGACLLRVVDDVLGEATCYCVPHDYLEAFYRKAGFRKVPLQGAPVFLQERWHDYGRRGLNVIIMKREGESTPKEAPI